MRPFANAFTPVQPIRLAEAARAVASMLEVDAELDEDDLRSDRCDEVRRIISTWRRGSTVSRREMKLAARMCATGDEPTKWCTKALDVVIGQDYRIGFRLLFEVYQQCYWHDGLRKYLDARAAEREGSRLPFPADVRDLVFAKDPARTIGQSAVARGLRLTEIVEANGLRQATALAHAVQTHVLWGASPDWYRQLTLEETQVALSAVLEGHQAICGFADAVFQTCSMSDWTPEVVNGTPFALVLFEELASTENLGPPGSNPARWKHASSSLRKLVQWWCTSREIDGFFGSVDAEPDRKQFWLRASRIIEEFNHYPACGVFAMKIGRWHFVEFGSIGNACYVYDEPAFRRIKADYDERVSYWRRTQPSVWKHRDQLRRVRPIKDQWGRIWHQGELRLMHYQGGRGWQTKFAIVIKSLTGENLD